MVSQPTPKDTPPEPSLPPEAHGAIFNAVPSGLFIIDAEGRIVDVNARAAQIFGYSRGEMVGRSVTLVLPERYRLRYFQCHGFFENTLHHRMLGAGRVFTGVRRDGAEIPIGVSLAACRFRDRPLIVGVIADISRRRRLLAEHRNLNRRFRHLLASSATIVYAVDVETRRETYLSENVTRLLGYGSDEIVGEENFWYRHLHPDDRRRVVAEYRKQLEGGEGVLEYRFRHADGAYRWIYDSFRVTRYCGGKPVEVLGAWTDISRLKAAETERDRMEGELRLAQKLEAVGQLASGIAHEINTPIQFVGDSVYFLQSAFEDLSALLGRYRSALARFAGAPGYDAAWSELREAEEEADLGYLEEEVPQAFKRTFEGIERVATIVRAMKEFGHVDQREKTATDLNKALQNTLTVARNEYKYVAEVETEFGDIPLVECLAGDINQVFLNLIVNAAHAIGDVVKDSGGRGSITLRTRREGEEVVIEIADSGAGIPDGIAGRVFDPFFTTKEVGKGTGQGLAIARTIVVDKHSGSLTFQSRPGQGTTFFIRLPVRAARAEA